MGQALRKGSLFLCPAFREIQATTNAPTGNERLPGGKFGENIFRPSLSRQLVGSLREIPYLAAFNFEINT